MEKISSSEIKKLILEAMQEYYNQNELEEQTGPSKQEVLQQINLLKFMRSTMKQVQMPDQLKNMVEQLQKSRTADFLHQQLGVSDNMTVKVSAFLQDPFALISDVVAELLNDSIRRANQKLQENIEEAMLEEDETTKLNVFHDIEDRKRKHEDKMKKKHQIPANSEPEILKKAREQAK